MSGPPVAGVEGGDSPPAPALHKPLTLARGSVQSPTLADKPECDPRPTGLENRILKYPV